LATNGFLPGTMDTTRTSAYVVCRQRTARVISLSKKNNSKQVSFVQVPSEMIEEGVTCRPNEEVVMIYIELERTVISPER